jgi:hypothetical protein
MGCGSVGQVRTTADAASTAVRVMDVSTPARRLCRDLSHRDCPKIHMEYARDVGWAVGLDSSLAQKILYRAYLDSISHPWLVSLLMVEGKFVLEPIQTLKRWHGPATAMLVEELGEPLQIGRIVDGTTEKCDGSMYDPAIRSMFVNAPCNPLARLNAGTVHISVGFNDLGELLSYPTSEDGEGAIHFVAIDISDFAVARSRVVQHMLSNPIIPIEHVFQVWYSAAWAADTLHSFLTACKEVLVSSGERDRTMKSYIHCWLSEHPISAIESRKRWFSLMKLHSSANIASSCSFHRKCDRNAILQYLFTGELVSSPKESSDNSNAKRSPSSSRTNKKQKAKPKPKLVGSMTVWNVPPHSAPLEQDSVFNTITLETVLDNLRETENIVECIIRIKLDQLSILRTKLVQRLEY